MKRNWILPVLLAASLLVGCNQDTASSSDSNVESVEESLPDTLTAYYDSNTFPDKYADLVVRYFNAIAEEDYAAYQACLYPAYYDCMERYLQKNHNYGMEQSFKNRHAGFLKEAHADCKTYRFTRVSLEYATNSSLDDFFDSNPDVYDEAFETKVKADITEGKAVLFTLQAQFDQLEPELVVEDVPMIIVQNADGCYLFG